MITTVGGCESYLGVTAHFLSPDFELKAVALDLAPFPGRHTAELVADKLIETHTNMDVIRDRVTCYVTDN